MIKSMNNSQTESVQGRKQKQIHKKKIGYHKDGENN